MLALSQWGSQDLFLTASPESRRYRQLFSVLTCCNECTNNFSIETVSGGSVLGKSNPRTPEAHENRRHSRQRPDLVSAFFSLPYCAHAESHRTTSIYSVAIVRPTALWNAKYHGTNHPTPLPSDANPRRLALRRFSCLWRASENIAKPRWVTAAVGRRKRSLCPSRAEGAHKTGALDTSYIERIGIAEETKADPSVDCRTFSVIAFFVQRPGLHLRNYTQVALQYI